MTLQKVERAEPSQRERWLTSGEPYLYHLARYHELCEREGIEHTAASFNIGFDTYIKVQLHAISHMGHHHPSSLAAIGEMAENSD